MDAAALKSLQAPLKDRYREDPAAALVTLRAEAVVDQETLACRLVSRRDGTEAGLHPATGGSGEQLCSGDLLLESLAACAGVTLAAVATAFGLRLTQARVTVEGEVDFRGTLGVARDAAVGFRAIRVRFDLASDAPDKHAKLVELTERYCVVYQTLARGVAVTTSCRTAS